MAKFKNWLKNISELLTRLGGRGPVVMSFERGPILMSFGAGCGMFGFETRRGRLRAPRFRVRRPPQLSLIDVKMSITIVGAVNWVGGVFSRYRSTLLFYDPELVIHAQANAHHSRTNQSSAFPHDLEHVTPA